MTTTRPNYEEIREALARDKGLGPYAVVYNERQASGGWDFIDAASERIAMRLKAGIDESFNPEVFYRYGNGQWSTIPPPGGVAH